MRISDWSSDVCSSDLTVDLEQLLYTWPEWLERIGAGAPVALLLLLGRKLRIVLDPACAAFADTGLGSRDGLGVLATMGHEEKYLLDRKSVVWGKSVSVTCRYSWSPAHYNKKHQNNKNDYI